MLKLHVVVSWPSGQCFSCISAVVDPACFSGLSDPIVWHPSLMAHVTCTVSLCCCSTWSWTTTAVGTCSLFSASLRTGFRRTWPSSTLQRWCWPSTLCIVSTTSTATSNRTTCCWTAAATSCWPTLAPVSSWCLTEQWVSVSLNLMLLAKGVGLTFFQNVRRYCYGLFWKGFRVFGLVCAIAVMYTGSLSPRWTSCCVHTHHHKRLFWSMSCSCWA